MRILVPVVDKIFASALIEFLINHQWSEDSSIEVLSVIEPPTMRDYGASLPEAFVHRLYQEEEKHAKLLVKTVAAKLRKAIPRAQVTEQVLTGNARELILETARNMLIDLIVMGSHGRQGWERFLLGSVSNAVVSMASCSVSVIRIPPGKDIPSLDLLETDSQKNIKRPAPITA